MLLVGSAVVSLVCLFWGVVFSLSGHWFIVALDVGCLVLAGITVHLLRQGRTREAARLMTAMLYVVMTFNTVFIDVPTPAVPRSTHAFMIGMAIATSLMLRDERPWVRHGVPLLFLLTYAVLGSSGFDPHTTLALPDSVRTQGIWVNNLFAVMLIYAALLVLQADASERHALTAGLRVALQQDQLQLHFQPQVDQHGTITGAEALLRWQHPERGMVSPGEFIPAAEDGGLMPVIGEWVLREACQRLALWSRSPPMAGLQLAVNVSASQFAQPDFVDKVLSALRRAGVEPARLKVELTESSLAHDLDDVIAKMAALRASGIGLSLDDFGTGFSSLSYLRRLPLDQLKIDQSFVRNLLASPNDAAIAQTVVNLGQSMGLHVIAEGVETEDQRQYLARIGCMAYQGYLFGRPVPAAAFEALVQASATAGTRGARAGSAGPQASEGLLELAVPEAAPAEA